MLPPGPTTSLVCATDAPEIECTQIFQIFQDHQPKPGTNQEKVTNSSTYPHLATFVARKYCSACFMMSSFISDLKTLIIN